MIDFEVNITPDAISVRTRRIRHVVDQDTGETLDIPGESHRQAAGLAGYPDAAAFQAAVSALITPVIGRNAADVVGRAAAAEATRDVAVSDKAKAIAERDAVAKERDDVTRERDALLAERDRRDAEPANPILETP